MKITVNKDLKIKGLSLVVKVGTQVKNIAWRTATTTSTARSMASGRWDWSRSSSRSC